MLAGKIKTLILLVILSEVTLASQKFDFKYSFDGEKLSISQEAPDYYAALTKAAKSCFTHFKSKAKSSHQKGIDLIDVCANPRS
tara:strand:+ start:15120 stop:15371 length:252 start_codon:yes stop_codon:yes gene_type:complete